MREFCRKEEPTVLEVRVGFVRVCLEDVRIFEVPRVVVMVDDMVGLIRALLLGDRGGWARECCQRFIAAKRKRKRRETTESGLGE